MILERFVKMVDSLCQYYTGQYPMSEIYLIYYNPAVASIPAFRRLVAIMPILWSSGI
jgi:hypothetical protein